MANVVGYFFKISIVFELESKRILEIASKTYMLNCHSPEQNNASYYGEVKQPETFL